MTSMERTDLIVNAIMNNVSKLNLNAWVGRVSYGEPSACKIVSDDAKAVADLIANDFCESVSFVKAMSKDVTMCRF